MFVNDTIADALTRIRNAQLAQHGSTRVLGTKTNLAICKILSENGYVGEFELVEEAPAKWIEVQLRYTEGSGNIRGIQRESKPGRRVYVKKDEIPQVLNGLGLAILSTSKGVLTGAQARAASTGGELLATVW